MRRTHRDPAPVLEWGARAALLAGVFAAPVVFDPRTDDAFNLAKITALLVFGAFSTALWLGSAFVGGRRERSTRLVRGALVVVAIAALATVLSQNRVVSATGLYHRYGGLASLVVYATYAWLVASMYRRREGGIVELVLTVAIAAVVVSVYVLFERAGIDPFHWQGPTTAPVGNLGNPDFTGGFLALALPFVGALAVSLRWTAARWTAALAAGLVIVGLLATGSRAGIVAAVCGVGAFVLFASRARAPVKVGAVCVVLAALSLVPMIVSRGSPVQGSGLLRTESVAYRGDEWGAAWRMFLHRPVLGSGPQTYYGNYTTFRSAEDARLRGIQIPDEPHNIFLDWLTSAGAVGFAAYLAVIAYALWLAAREHRTRGSPSGVMASAFGGLLVAYLVQGLFSIDVPPLAVMGWVAVGGISALAAPLGPVTARATASPWRYGAAAAAGAAAVVVVVVGFRPLRADHAVWAAGRAGAFTPRGRRLEQKAIRLDPVEAAYRSIAASSFEHEPGASRAALLRAAALYRQALRIQPRNLYFVLDLLRIYEWLGRSVSVAFFTQADGWSRRAVSLDPLDPQVRDLRAELLSDWALRTTDPSTRAALQARSRAASAEAAALRRR